MKNQAKSNLTNFILSGAVFIIGALILALVLGDSLSVVEIASKISGGAGG